MRQINALFENRTNPRRGRDFEERAVKALTKKFDTEFEMQYAIKIGNPPTEHRFDLVSKDKKYIVECKCYSWQTKGGNIPSGRIAALNEALLYLSYAPRKTYRYIILPKSLHNTREETFAQYYVRRFKHLFDGVKVLEIDEDDNINEIS